MVEWTSRQNGSRPSTARRCSTTSRAAIFSATKSTRLPRASALAMSSEIVCDLPVPGGPCRTKLCPSTTAFLMASIWEESASAGSSSVDGSTFSPGSMGSGVHVRCPSIIELTILLSRRSSSLLRMSLHMTNWENEKSPIMPFSSTSQPFWSITLLSTVLRTRRVSTPASSVGRGSSPLIEMP